MTGDGVSEMAAPGGRDTCFQPLLESSSPPHLGCSASHLHWGRAWGGPGALGGAVPGGLAVGRAADVLSKGRVVGGMHSPGVIFILSINI